MQVRQASEWNQLDPLMIELIDDPEVARRYLADVHYVRTLIEPEVAARAALVADAEQIARHADRSTRWRRWRTTRTPISRPTSPSIASSPPATGSVILAFVLDSLGELQRLSRRVTNRLLHAAAGGHRRAPTDPRGGRRAPAGARARGDAGAPEDGRARRGFPATPIRVRSAVYQRRQMGGAGQWQMSMSAPDGPSAAGSELRRRDRAAGRRARLLGRDDPGGDAHRPGPERAARVDVHRQLRGARRPRSPTSIGGVICLGVAVVLTQLAKQFTGAGGYFLYVSRTLGPRTGWITTWLYFLYDPIAVSSVCAYTSLLVRADAPAAVRHPHLVVLLVLRFLADRDGVHAVRDLTVGQGDADPRRV